jgi:hypothetical protein
VNPNGSGAGPDTTRTSPHTQDPPTAKQASSCANGSASASAARAAAVRDIGGRRHDTDAAHLLTTAAQLRGAR